MGAHEAAVKIAATMNLSSTNLDEVMLWPEVHAVVKLARVTFWRHERAGIAPKRRRLGKSRVCWLRSEIMEYVKNLQVIA